MPSVIGPLLKRRLFTILVPETVLVGVPYFYSVDSPRPNAALWPGSAC